MAYLVIGYPAMAVGVVDRTIRYFYLQPVEGVVTSSGIGYERGDAGMVSPDATYSREATFAFPKISYRYVVQGRSFEGKDVWLYVYANEATASNMADLRELLARFPPGAKTPIWYDLRNPARAVLVREFPIGPLIFFALTTGFAFGVCTICGYNFYRAVFKRVFTDSV